MTEPAELPGWSIPTLLIGGEHDRLFAPEVLRGRRAPPFQGRVSSAFRIVGHSPYFEAPDEFNRS